MSKKPRANDRANAIELANTFLTMAQVIEGKCALGMTSRMLTKHECETIAAALRAYA